MIKQRFQRATYSSTSDTQSRSLKLKWKHVITSLQFLSPSAKKGKLRNIKTLKRKEKIANYLYVLLKKKKNKRGQEQFTLRNTTSQDLN